MNEHDFMLACLGFILTAASYTDIRNERIANSLTFPAILAGIALNTYLSTGIGFQSSLSGFALGMLCFLPFYVVGGMAAGDVKLMGAVGTFVGTPLILKAVLMSLVCGSILGIVWLIRFRGVSELLHRYLLVGKYILMTGSLQYFPPAKDAPARLRFPYALAIACGTATVLWASY